MYSNWLSLLLSFLPKNCFSIAQYKNNTPTPTPKPYTQCVQCRYLNLNLVTTTHGSPHDLVLQSFLKLK